MKHFLRVITPVILLVIVLGLSSCGSMSRKTETFVLNREISNLSTGTLKVETKNGKISVQPWDNDYIKIEGEKFAQGIGDLDKELDKIDIVYREFGDSVSVYAEFPDSVNSFFKAMNHGAGFRLLIPKDRFNEIETRTSNGEVDLTSLNGRAIVNTSNGKVNLSDINGYINVNTSNGDVSLYNINAEMDIDTSNGKIIFSGCTATGFKNSFVTSNSRIYGDLILPVSGDMKMSTSNGAIDLNIPMNAQVHFRANTSNAGIDVTGLSYILNKSDKGYKEGRINNGGLNLSLKTSNGKIRLTGN